MTEKPDRPERQSFAESNRQMLEKELFCDVAFVAGANETKVRAHRCVLASRCQVFYTMFCGMLPETDVIKIPDIEPDVLKQLFLYLYTGTIDITRETGLGLLYAAEKYGEEDLKVQCYETLQGDIDIDSVCPVLTYALAIGQDDLVNRCLSFIQCNADKVLGSNKFVELTKDVLKMVVTSDNLGAPEVTVHMACMRWAREQCDMQDIEATDANLRDMLGDLVFSIRYPLFSDMEIQEHIQSSSFLTDEEKQIISTIKQDTSSGDDKFPGRPRFRVFSPSSSGSFIRYDGVIKTYSYSNITDLVCITCSHNVKLTGVHLFSPSDAGSLRGELVIYDQDTTLLKQAITVPYQSVKNKNIVLESPIILKAGLEYFIEHKLFGPATFNGMNGRKEITKDGVTLTFSTTEKVKNSVTYEDTGHLYGLEFA